MKRLLWIGDAACDSGFARSTHEILARFPLSEYEIHVIGINYRGDPHKYPYLLYPAYVIGCKDFFGKDRIAELVPEIDPHIIIVQNDPWSFPGYIEELRKVTKAPVIGIVAVDGKNCSGDCLNGLDHAIFWTEFGRNEAAAGGMTVPSSVIPLGVDLEIYKPQDRRKARIEIGLPENLLDTYIVGNVNRNQPRKRLDLTVDYFCQWIKDYDIDDAYLFLHIAPTGENGYNCEQLMRYYGVKKRLIRSEPQLWKGVSEADLALEYACFDVQITTTQGEGFGLTTLEGMACGIPQIVPGAAALGEWTRDAACIIPCDNTIATHGRHNHIGGLPNRHETIETLVQLYDSERYRFELAEAGLALCNNPRYRWDNIGQAVVQEVEQVMSQSVQEDLQKA